MSCQTARARELKGEKKAGRIRRVERRKMKKNGGAREIWLKHR